MVGDDVVDLHDPAIATHHLRTRFLDRVLHPDERAALAVARSPEVLLWSYFAAKEAAYKVAVKRDPSVILAHRRFVVSPTLASVRHEDRDLALVLDVDEARGFAHAIAWSEGPMPLHALATLAAPHDVSTPGVEARALLCRTIAGRLGCAVEALSIVRRPVAGSWDGFAPPRLTRDGRDLDLDVSLSHDGRFVSFAAELPRS